MNDFFLEQSEEAIDTWLAQSAQHAVIRLASEEYPDLLRQIPDPPALLYAIGDTSLLSTPQIAIVGSRNPTYTGAETAKAFAAFLSNAGLTVTSGMARGIDAASHQGALSATSKTIAVLGTGIDIVYPTSNQALAATIAEKGLIISEFPLGTSPQAKNFPLRNRIISGLSMGVLVVEAALRSGSLITARLALEQGRDVFAIPSSIHNAQAKGCHQLIKQGAKLVETAQDIVEELAALLGHVGDLTSSENKQVGRLTSLQKRILAVMDYDPLTVDELVTRCDLSSAEISTELLNMELEGLIQTVPGGYLNKAHAK